MSSRNAPAGDFRVENHGSIFLLVCLNDTMRDHLLENISPEAQWWGPNALAVEPRFIEPLASQLVEEGWVLAV